MRCFVAVWPPPPVLIDLQRLERPALDAGRWMPPESWHVTLRFVGTVEGDEVDRLVAGAGDAAATSTAAMAEMGPATTLLRPGVLVAPVAGLDGLAAGVVQATAGIGQPPDDRPFAGHITLARARGRGRLPRHLAGRALTGRWRVEELTVVRSHLSSAGARYERLAVLPVGRPLS